MKNEVGTKSSKKLGFNECRYIDGRIKKLDRLTFRFDKEGVQGTFEIDELPQADSQLLLIVQKSPAEKQNMLAFQSFAFAPSEGSENAQVAFLNAVAGDSDTHLRMQDSLIGRKTATREEQVMFNRVYAIEEGSYDVVFNNELKSLRRSLALHGGKDYVILKTGSKKHPHLLVFPDDLSGSVFGIFEPFVYGVVIFGPLVAIAICMYFTCKPKYKARISNWYNNKNGTEKSKPEENEPLVTAGKEEA